MKKESIRITFGNTISDRINFEANKETCSHSCRHYHRKRHHRKPRFNPIDAALRCVSSKTFNISKAIPHLSRQHLLAWGIDTRDESEMLIQFNCKTHCLGYRNMRLNCYLTKPTQEHPYGCVVADMRDLDSRTSVGITTAFFPKDIYKGRDLLEYILVEMLGAVSLWDQTQYAAFLVGEISFYRTRTLSVSESEKALL